MTSGDSDDRPGRDEALAQLAVQGRLLHLAMMGLSTAAAARFGLQVIDQQCSGLLHQTGPISVGRLAELAGLTPSSVTGVVDRLERADLLRREPDPHDRRKVILVPLRSVEIEEVFQPLAQRFQAMYARYDDQELALLNDFLLHMTDNIRAHITTLRTRRSPDPAIGS
ncbi:MarR family winged helix-turn-helix transcriptional regulator [Actinomadura hibisca]|uniref:MarR family winged helix-turn-helix transcriptional regulator n=1 Tax=Actinomadura hibisca TaxID=68565 RepID=UPI000835FFFD|nr:MarR family transcriptional regulator [Actinomadura hibisca]